MLLMPFLDLCECLYQHIYSLYWVYPVPGGSLLVLSLQLVQEAKGNPGGDFPREEGSQTRWRRRWPSSKGRLRGSSGSYSRQKPSTDVNKSVGTPRDRPFPGLLCTIGAPFHQRLLCQRRGRLHRVPCHQRTANLCWARSTASVSATGFILSTFSLMFPPILLATR